MTTRRGFLGLLAAAPVAAPAIAKAAVDDARHSWLTRGFASGGYVSVKSLCAGEVEAIVSKPITVSFETNGIQEAVDAITAARRSLEMDHHAADAIDYMMKGCDMTVITDDMPPRVKAMLAVQNMRSPPLVPFTTPDRKGSWMQLASGRQFWPMDPRPEEIHIDDIAAALSKMCRYGGHCREFYSVAEHCVHMAHAAPDGFHLSALLHDASEAYLSDVIRPIKSHLTNYLEIEANLERAIAQRFSIPFPMPAEVKRLDNAILRDEREQAMASLAVSNEAWGAPLDALGVTLQFWTPEKARYEFLAAFRRYGGHWC